MKGTFFNEFSAGPTVIDSNSYLKGVTPRLKRNTPFRITTSEI